MHIKTPESLLTTYQSWYQQGLGTLLAANPSYLPLHTDLEIRWQNIPLFLAKCRKSNLISM